MENMKNLELSFHLIWSDLNQYSLSPSSDTIQKAKLNVVKTGPEIEPVKQLGQTDRISANHEVINILITYYDVC